MDLVVVLGVHRSGTSLLASGVQTLGFDLCQQDTECDADNPTGYNEQVEIRAFNDRLLAHLGTSWDDWTFRSGLIDWDDPAVLPWILEADGLLKTIFRGCPKGVLKDPRITMLFPFWKRIFGRSGYRVRYVLAMRNPLEVAKSQVIRAARDPGRNILIRSAEPMLALWAVTMHEFLHHAPAEGFLAIDFEMLQARPDLALAAIAAHLEVRARDDTICAFQTTQVRPDLYRSRVAGGGERSAWGAAAAEIWEALRAGDAQHFDVASCAVILDHLTAIQGLLPSLQASRETIAAALTWSAPLVTAPEIIWYLSPLVTEYAPTERIRELLSIIELVAPGSEHSLSVMFLKAVLHERLGNIRSAIRICQALCRDRPGDESLTKHLGRLCAQVESSHG